MPPAIQHFSQAVTRRPQSWSTTEQIRQEFDHKGHKTSFLTTLVTYVMALHNIYHLWQQRIVDTRIGCLQTKSVERLYPLSPFQRVVFKDIVNSLAQRQRFLPTVPSPPPLLILLGAITAYSWESQGPASHRC